MDKTALVEAYINDGKKLIETLVKAQFPIKAALWFYMTDAEEWRLLIASPIVEEKGPNEAYTLIQKELEQLSLDISLNEVSVLSPRSELIRLIRATIKTGTKIAGIRFTGNVIQNKLIEDAYIYLVI